MSQSVQCKFDWALSHTRRSDAAEKKKKKIACTLWTKFACGQVSSPRLYRLKNVEKFWKNGLKFDNTKYFQSYFDKGWCILKKSQIISYQNNGYSGLNCPQCKKCREVESAPWAEWGTCSTSCGSGQSLFHKIKLYLTNKKVINPLQLTL